jgi:glycogen debranching enzyme
VPEFLTEALENIRGTIRYYKIQEKKPLITSEFPLVNRYFSVLGDKKQSKVVHNGWILDAKPDVDFATEVNFNYLRRTINIWGDSIKLRFGRCPADSPFLWSHMSKYVT